MTPSKMRREGRNHYMQGADPREEYPFKKDAWGYESNFSNFLDGWNEAERNETAEALDEENLTEEREQCPWRDNRLCKASGAFCREENCAVLYWIGKR